MGAGRQSLRPSVSKEKPDAVLETSAKPPFTLGQIKKAIPPHCFERSVLRSFSYVVYDFIMVSLLYYVSTNYIDLLPKPLSYLAWSICWFVQGCVLTGVWIIAHECGHHAFSDYEWLDDTVGLIIHSFLLVSYFPWKYSHKRHHSNPDPVTMEVDEVCVPKMNDKLQWFSKYINNPPGRILTLTLGWPLYLIFNLSGQKYERFAAYGPIYSDRKKLLMYLSDAGVMAMAYGLFRVAAAKGIVWVLCVYWGPFLVMNGFLRLISFVQHRHFSLPRYDSSEWKWLRSALCTVDTDFGILNKVFHNVTNTHVAHHLCSTIPHYHAKEATKAIRPILGQYYHNDRTPVYKTLWREAW